MKLRIVRRALCGLLVVAAGFGLTGCNGNFSTRANCEIGIALLNQSGALKGNWGLWDGYFKVYSNNRGMLWNCRAITLDSGGAYATFSIFDDDVTMGGDGDFDPTQPDFWPLFIRFDMEGTARVCQGVDVDRPQSVGCSGT